MNVPPDYLAPNLRVVFCGTAAGNRSAEVGHYYAGPGNEFWPLLYRSGIVPVALTLSRIIGCCDSLSGSPTWRRSARQAETKTCRRMTSTPLALSRRCSAIVRHRDAKDAFDCAPDRRPAFLFA